MFALLVNRVLIAQAEVWFVGETLFDSIESVHEKLYNIILKCLSVSFMEIKIARVTLGYVHFSPAAILNGTLCAFRQSQVIYHLSVERTSLYYIPKE